MLLRSPRSCAVALASGFDLPEVGVAALWTRRGVPQPRPCRGPSLRSGPSGAARLRRRDRRSAPAAHPRQSGAGCGGFEGV